MIYCVWYPSGGFGHFVNTVLTLHGKNFVRPTGSATFSTTGDSHSLDLVAPKYQHNCWPGGIEFLNDRNYSVLIDNGIDDENENFRFQFINATVIKMCYNNYSWPIVARTMIEKAMKSTLDQQLPIDNWYSNESWVYREKYFLYLRDHHFRTHWQATNDNDIDVWQMLDYQEFYTVLNSIVETEDFYNLWRQWRTANRQYLDPVEIGKNVLSHLVSKWPLDLTQINDVWTQAVIYYFIWLHYQYEIPHNDYKNFFNNTQEIVDLLENSCVY